MDEPSIPGAFPTAAEESTTTTNRTPKRRFVGRRTADAQAKQRHETNGSVEETTAVVAKSAMGAFDFLQRSVANIGNQVSAKHHEP